jgi:hypothetical protein
LADKRGFDMKKSSYVVLLILTAILLCAVKNTTATTMIKYSITDLTQKASNIIIGKVVDKKSGWNKNKTRIYTYTTVEVAKDIKGVTSSKAITIMTPGGVVGEVGLKIVGTEQYEIGEQIVIFLDKDDDRYSAVGTIQGKFNIVKDGVTGAKKVINKSTDKVMFMKRDGTKAEEEKPEAMGLDEFIAIIESNL